MKWKRAILVCFLLLNKAQDHKQLRVGIYFTLNSKIIHEGQSGKKVREGTGREELKQRPWKKDDYWLVLHYWICLLSHTTQSSLPRCGTSPNDLDAPTTIIHLTVSLQALLEVKLMGTFSPLSFPFQSNSLFNKWCWQNRVCTCRRMKLVQYFPHCTKIKSKWIKDLNITPAPQKNLKLLEEAIVNGTQNTEQDVLNCTPIAQKLALNINSWNYVKF